MRAVGYYNPQPSNAAPDHSAQEDPLAAIKRYCVEELHQLVTVVPPEGASDASSEASGNWGGYSKLVELFTGPDGRPALVVIPDSSHLAADLEQLVRRVIEIEAIGGTIRCADVDAPDPLQDGLSRLALPGRAPERQRRIREAILSKAIRGEALGRLPFGYRAGADGMPAPVPGEAEIVAHIFDWYLGEPEANQGADGDEPGDQLGDGSGGLGFRRIAARLNEQGVMTRSGNRWSPVAVAGLLRNRAYIGTYSRQGIRLVTNHPPLVDRAVFNRAQEVLRTRQPSRRSPKSSRFRLRGLLRCAQCGSGVHGVTRARRWTRADGTEVARDYLYYECPARPPRSDKQSNHAAWRAEELEAAVMGELEKLPPAVPRSSSRTITGEDPAPARLRALEREFMRRYREVAHGRGRVQTLGPLLDEIERLRSGGYPAGPGGSDAAELPSDRDELMRRAAGDDIEEARRALRQMIARADVGASEIEVTPRGEIADPV